MNTRRYLQQMGVPVWRLRVRRPVETVATTASIPEPAAEPLADKLYLQVDIGTDAPGKQLVEEMLQVLQMHGLEVEVRYEAGEREGMQLAGLALPSVKQLLARPAEKAALWQTLMQWLETHGTGGANPRS